MAVHATFSYLSGANKQKAVELRINGIAYVIEREIPFEADGRQRVGLILRRPNGTQKYHAVRYENGSLSSASPI